MSQSHGRIVHAGLFAFCFAIASASAGISQVTLSNFQLNVANPSVDIAITPVCPPTPDVLGRCQLPAGGGCVPNVTALECTSLGGVFGQGQTCPGIQAAGSCCNGTTCTPRVTAPSCAGPGTNFTAFADCLPIFEIQVFRTTSDAGNLLFTLQPGLDFVVPTASGTVLLPGLRAKLDNPSIVGPNNRLANNEVLILRARILPDTLSNEVQATAIVRISLTNFVVDNEHGPTSVQYSITAPARVRPFQLAFTRDAAPLTTQSIDDTTPVNAPDTNALNPGAHNLVSQPGQAGNRIQPFLDVLYGLPAGNRIRDGQTLNVQLIPNGNVTGDSVLNRNVVANVVVNVLALVIQPTPRMTYHISAPATIDAFSPQILRGAAESLATNLPLDVDGVAFEPGADRTYNFTLANFRNALGALANGNRVQHGDQLKVRANPPAAGAFDAGSDLESDAVAAVVNIAINTFSFHSVTNDANSRDVTVSYTIDAPGRIDSFGLNLRRGGATDLGLLRNVTTDALLDPGAHSIIDLSASFVTLLNALPNTQRIKNGQLLSARVTPSRAVAASPIDSTQVAATVDLAVTAFSYNQCDGGNARFSYSLNSPANVDTFTVDLFRDGVGGANDDVFSFVNDESLCDSVTFNGGDMANVGLLTPGVHNDIALDGFRDCLDNRSTGQRIRDKDSLYAVIQSQADLAPAINARQDACVNLILTSVSNTLDFGGGGTTVNAVVRYDICAPGRVERFNARIGSDLDTIAPGLEPGSAVLKEVQLQDPDLKPGSHEAALQFTLDPAVETYVATLDLDTADSGVIAESLCNATNADVLDNFQTFRIAAKVKINSLVVERPAGSGTIATVKYQILLSQAAPFAFEFRLLDGSANPPRIGQLVPIVQTAKLQPGVEQTEVVALPQEWGGGIQNGDKIEVRLVTTDGNPHTQSEAAERSREQTLVVNLTASKLSLGDTASIDYSVDALAAVRPFDLQIVLPGATAPDDKVLTTRGVSAGEVSLRLPGSHSVTGLAFLNNLIVTQSASAACPGSTLEARVDPTNLVAESNAEDNKTSVAQFSYPTDIRVSNLVFTDVDGKVVEKVERATRFGVSFKLEILQNRLNGEFELAVLADAIELKRAQLVDVQAQRFECLDQRVKLRDLDVGSYSVSILVCGPSVDDIKSAFFTVRVVADPANAGSARGVICETNEDNNAVLLNSLGTGVEADSDGDGLTDTEEEQGFFVSRYTTTPEVPLTADEIRRDFACTIENSLSNGIFRWQCLVKTDPTNPDSDGDKVDDFSEVVTYAIGADSNGRVKGAGQTGASDLPGQTFDGVNPDGTPRAVHPELALIVRGNRPVLNKIAPGVRTDPTRADSDGDGLLDDADPAPQIRPSLFLLPANASQEQKAALDADTNVQSLVLNFDQDGDGFVEAPDANGDGVPDFTRFNELTLEGLFGIDFSNDGSLRDGFDIGGATTDPVDAAFLAPLGVTGDDIGPVDDPAKRTLAGVSGVDRDTLIPRFGNFRVGSIQSFDRGLARFQPTAKVRVAPVASDSEANPPGAPTLETPHFLQFSTTEARASVFIRRGNGRIDQVEVITANGQQFNVATFPVDNCPGDASDAATLDVRFNPDQADIDNDGIGDTCDPDRDNDGVPDGFERSIAGCGAPCGAGVLPMMPLVLAGLMSGKWWLRRRTQR